MKKNIKKNIYINDYEKIFSQRISISYFIIIIFFLILVSRLFFIQVIQNSKYILLSNKNRIETKFILPLRGKILDVNGIPLSQTNKFCYSFIDVRKVFDVGLTIKKIESIFEIKNIKKIEAIINQEKEKKLKNHQKKIITVKKFLTWKEIALVETLPENSIGICIGSDFNRKSKYPIELGHTIGYVSYPNKIEIKNDSELKIYGSVVGKLGLEKSLDKILRGKYGFLNEEVISIGERIKLIDLIKPIPGSSQKTTIDINLQKKIIEILDPIIACSVIVMDLKTGGIRSILSKPLFNFDIFTEKISNDLWKEILTDENSRMLNRSISGLYAPGSVFKMIVGLAALKEKIVKVNTCFTCTGVHEIGNRKVHCWKWKNGGHGVVNIVSAISESCDIYFYKLAEKLGKNQILEMAEKFGLGNLVGIELSGEKNYSYEKIKKMKTTGGDILNFSIGQGEILVTPIQLLKMTAMIATGKESDPHLLQINDYNISDMKKIDVSTESLKIIHFGMYEAVNGKIGTAKNSASKIITFSGKTGTSQVYKIKKEEREKMKRGEIDLKKIEYKLRDHSIFIAFAPSNFPEYAVLVLVEHGGGGAVTAAPIAKKILEYIYGQKNILN